MKRRGMLAGLAVVVGLLISGGEAFAQFGATITVDENGNGLFSNSNGFFSPLPASLVADPGPGGLPVALTYGLLSPPGLVAGDLILVEPGSANGDLSDIIRFNPQQNGGSLVFYSDITDGVDSLADVGFPNGLYTNNLSALEVGPEIGPNGFTYTPTAGQPGFVAGAGGPVTYVIQSDLAVPEPSSFVLGSIGAFALLGFKLIRRRRAA